LTGCYLLGRLVFFNWFQVDGQRWLRDILSVTFLRLNNGWGWSRSADFFGSVSVMFVVMMATAQMKSNISFLLKFPKLFKMNSNFFFKFEMNENLLDVERQPMLRWIGQMRWSTSFFYFNFVSLDIRLVHGPLLGYHRGASCRRVMCAQRSAQLVFI
jgi:hypothetical protein